jgi:rubrerythrin
MNKNLKDRADALLQRIYQDGYTHGYNEGIKQLENYVSHPVGHWIPSHIPESILDECSECGFSCGAFTFKYCPNCGAKMETEEET